MIDELRQFKREWLVYAREPRQIAYACLFFIVILVFFPLTISADPALLRVIAPGLVWVDLLLAFFLSSERLFQQDYDDGVIEQWLVSGHSLPLLVTVKVLVHCVLTLVPMLIMCPLLALLFSFSVHETLILMASLVCGAPAMVFLCALAAAFSTGLKQTGLLMALVVFPLTIPIMIFGSSTLLAALQGLPVVGFLALLLAFSLFAVMVLPTAIAAVVRINLVD